MEPVLNNGIQEFVITPVNDYYSVKYVTDQDNDIHSYTLYVAYGEDRLIDNFKRLMANAVKMSWWKEISVLEVYIYSYVKVDYRRNVDGETYTSYDLYRKKIQTKLNKFTIGRKG